MKKIIIIMFLLMIPLVTATFTNEWGEYQDDYTSRGFVNDERGYFETGITKISIAQGTNFQALLIDADNDGNIEGIGSNGNYVMVWSITNSAITEIASISLGAAQTTQHTALPPNYDGDEYTEWITIHGSNISVLEYNGTSLNLQCSNTTLATTISGIRCKNISGTIGCYWTTNGGNITEFNPLTCGITQYNIGGNTLFNIREKLTPVIEDIDNDGSQNIIINCQNSTIRESICSIEQNSMTLDWRRQFSGASTNTITIGGILVYPMAADSSSYDSCVKVCDDSFPLVNVPIIGLLYKLPYNSCVNGCGFFLGTGTYGGSNKVITSYSAAGGANEFVQDGFMAIINNDGSISSNIMVYDDGGSATAAIAGGVTIINRNDSFNSPVCTVFKIGVTQTRLYCIDYSGTIVYATSNLPISLSPTVGSLELPAARMLSNSSYFQLVKANNIIELKDGNAVTIHNISTGAILSGSTSLADVNKDLSLDVCVQNAGVFSCLLASIIDEPPEIYNNYSYGGYGHDLSAFPVCLNSSVNFVGQECGGTASCNYDNDLEENVERLVSNCGKDFYGSVVSGYDTFLVFGDYAGSNPSFSCYYNVTGTFSVRLYLQDASNNDTYSQYNTQPFSITVIDGEPGVTCDVSRVSIIPAVTPSAGDPTESQQFLDNVNNIFSDIGITSQTGKTMFWLLLMIALAFLIFSSYSGEGIVYIIALLEVVMLVLGWVLGMVGTVPLVIVGLVTALLLTYLWLRSPGGG